MISTQASQYRQFALISEFLDLANLSIREEAALATNWSKDRLEGLYLQNLALATITGKAIRRYPDNVTADVQHACNQCESFGSGKQLILHCNPSAISSDFSTAYVSSSTSCFAEYAIGVLFDITGTLGGNFGIFAASGESHYLGTPPENPFKTNWREGLSCSPVQFLQDRI